MIINNWLSDSGKIIMKQLCLVIATILSLAGCSSVVSTKEITCYLPLADEKHALIKTAIAKSETECNTNKSTEYCGTVLQMKNCLNGGFSEKQTIVFNLNRPDAKNWAETLRNTFQSCEKTHMKTSFIKSTKKLILIKNSSLNPAHDIEVNKISLELNVLPKAFENYQCQLKDYEISKTNV
jgi:hypothetical protein